MSMRRSATLVPLLLGALPAQTIRTVGPGGFPQIQPAIAASSPGDIVVVLAGVYAAFTLDKALTLTAAPGAVVAVSGQQFFTLTPTTFLVPAGQQANVVGLQFQNQLPFFRTDVRVFSGTVHFSDCAFEGHLSFAQPGLLVRTSHVVLQRCIVLGGGTLSNNPTGRGGAGGDGLQLDQATLAATDSLFLGGHLGFDFTGHGGHGIVADGSSLQLANCTAMGGNIDMFGSGLAGHGILMRTNGPVWLADCHVFGGSAGGGNGAVALRNQGTTPVEFARNVFGSGFGTLPGPPVIGPSAAAPLLGTTPTGPLRLGTTWQATYVGSPGTPVIALVADRLAPGLDARVVQPTWAPLGSAVAAFGITGANGTIAFGFAIPPNPALIHAVVWLHGFAGMTLPLQAAPPVGGVVR